MNDKHPPADRHLPAREIFPNIWFIASENAMSVPLGLKVKFSRNMLAVLQDDGWVLLGPVRISDAEEKKLTDKAPIKHLVRLGTFHNRDDAYYKEKFPEATFWACPGKQDADAPPIDRQIGEDGNFPIPGANVVIFKGTSQAECVVHLPQHKLLVTCDSVQHYDNDPHVNFIGKLMMRKIGFFTPCVIGPFWLKLLVPKGGSVKADFERILALDFDNLVSGHGTPKIGGAKAALAGNVANLA